MATSSSSGNNTSLKVSLSANIESADKTNNIGEKSLKSQRTYQVGVVFKDIYGRETPVFTDKKGTFTVPKAVCDKKSSIVTKLDNKVPNWVDTYKFFVKETSNEYYNACMDRWYDSEDGNLWLSFPSAERNKMQEDGYIILKKQAVSQDAVIEEARYKIIDIQNGWNTAIEIDFDTADNSGEWKLLIKYEEDAGACHIVPDTSQGDTTFCLSLWGANLLQQSSLDRSFAEEGGADLIVLQKFDSQHYVVSIVSPLRLTAVY